MRELTGALIAGLFGVVASPAWGQIVLDMPAPATSQTASAAEEAAATDTASYSDESADGYWDDYDPGVVALTRYAQYRNRPSVSTVRFGNYQVHDISHVYYGPPIGLYSPYGYGGYPFFGGFGHFGFGHRGFGHSGFGHFGFHGSGVHIRVSF